jgi:hypothetical protein
MPLEYKEEDINFSMLITEYNQARTLLERRMERGDRGAAEKLVLASERFLTSIIDKIRHGTQNQSVWVLMNRDQINEEVRQLKRIRQHLGMNDSPVNEIPQSPLAPNTHEQEHEEEQTNPQPHSSWRALENVLFFGGLAMNASGFSQIVTGGYQALQGGYALFKATEAVGKKAAEAVVSTGLAKIGAGYVTAKVGDVLIEATIPGNGSNF